MALVFSGVDTRADTEGERAPDSAAMRAATFCGPESEGMFGSPVDDAPSPLPSEGMPVS